MALAAELGMKIIALVLLILTVTAERAEGHLEGGWRAAALREADRVICQMGEGRESTSPAVFP